MYKVIGSDQKEYGPISVELMQQWIREGRVNGATLVWSEAGGNWKPLSTFSEFASYLPAGASRILPGALGTTEADRPRALSKAVGPAVALFILAGLEIVFAIIGLLGNGLSLSTLGDTPEAKELAALMTGPLGIGMTIACIAKALFIAFAAWKLKTLDSYGIALAGSIVALIPCGSCCCVGIPIGIWALVVMNAADVKPHFK